MTSEESEALGSMMGPTVEAPPQSLPESTSAYVVDASLLEKDDGVLVKKLVELKYGVVILPRDAYQLDASLLEENDGLLVKELVRRNYGVVIMPPEDQDLSKVPEFHIVEAHIIRHAFPSNMSVLIYALGAYFSSIFDPNMILRGGERRWKNQS